MRETPGSLDRSARSEALSRRYGRGLGRVFGHSFGIGFGHGLTFGHGHRVAAVRATTSRELWRAALAAADALVTFAGYVATLSDVLEMEPRGTLEWELLCFLGQLEAETHPVLAVHPGLRQVAAWARAAVRPDAAQRRSLRDMPPGRRAAPAVMRRLIDSQGPDGSWAINPAASQLPDSQAEYLRTWLHTAAAGLLQLRPPPLPSVGRPAG